MTYYIKIHNLEKASMEVITPVRAGMDPTHTLLIIFIDLLILLIWFQIRDYYEFNLIRDFDNWMEECYELYGNWKNR